MPLPLIRSLCVIVWFTTAQIVSAQTLPHTVEAYPEAKSKKGLQVELVDDALALGVQHATFNVNLCSLIDPDKAPESLPWQHAGKTFYFKSNAVESLDRQIKTLSDRGVLVYVILLTYQSGQEAIDQLMIHPRCIAAAPNRLGAFNTVTDDGRMWLSATLEFLAERWSRADQRSGRVVGYIVGNEVNSHWWWSNMGRVTMQEFAQQYAQAVQIIFSAVRSQSSSARVYISLEHHWNMRYPAGDDQQSFPAREFLDYFASVPAAQQSEWHLAFHPYPENLFEPRFWRDRTAVHQADTPRITFNNMEQLVAAMRAPHLLLAGKPRRIIFSEQGFHTPPAPDGEAIQAAAFCYAYKKIERLEGVDAFILHRHVDHDHEGGLLLGLRRNKPTAEDSDPHPVKQIYGCFRDADTPKWAETFSFALPIIGAVDWDSALQDPPPPTP